MKSILITLMCLVGCDLTSRGEEPTSTIEAALASNLGPIAWSIGSWQCVGRYETVPPFTVAHDVKALFVVHSSTGGGWLDGQYTEVAQPEFAPTSISEHFTIDPTGAGLRHLEDSNFGRLDSGFTLTPSGVEFTGAYTIFGQSVPFTETLTHASISASTTDQFSTESRVVLSGVPAVFHRQTCTKRADIARGESSQ
jgi:hypothetical protein